MNRTVLIAMLALSACQAEFVPADDDNSGAASPVASGSAAAAPQPSATIDPARLGYERTPVTLMADGIILVGAVDGVGAATNLAFGQDRGQVLAAMGEAFPRPDLSNNAECGAGPMNFAKYGKLTLNFADGKFAGWMAEHADNLATADGVKVGNTLAEIKRERSAQRVAGSTLDGEFEYATGDGGTIGGFLSGPGDSATVRSLYAGTNCFFR